MFWVILGVFVVGVVSGSIGTLKWGSKVKAEEQKLSASVKHAEARFHRR